MKNNELNDRRLQATPRGIGVMCNFYADKAENATVWDVEGNEYIDFAAGIAVLNTGHRHPKIISAIHFILFCNFKLNISKIKSIKMIKELFLKNFSKIT